MGDRIQTAWQTVCALLAGFWAMLPPLVAALIILMAIDIVSGILKAALNGRVASDIAFKGILKKAVVLLVVLAANVLQFNAVGLGLSFPFEIASAVAAFYCMHEAISILENAAAMGIPLPDFLKRALGIKEESKQ